MYILMFSSR